MVSVWSPELSSQDDAYPYLFHGPAADAYGRERELALCRVSTSPARQARADPRAPAALFCCPSDNCLRGQTE